LLAARIDVSVLSTCNISHNQNHAAVFLGYFATKEAVDCTFVVTIYVLRAYLFSDENGGGVQFRLNCYFFL